MVWVSEASTFSLGSSYGSSVADWLTCMTAALGPFFSPFVTMFQISSYGGSSSGDIVIKGESHLTMEEGSSNRMIRLSKLPRD